MHNSCDGLSLIRCLIDSLEFMLIGEPLPNSLCYVPSLVSYCFSGKGSINVYSQPNFSAITSKISDDVEKILCTNTFVTNEIGRWLKLSDLEKDKYFQNKNEGWVLLDCFKETSQGPRLVISKKNSTATWLCAIAKAYSLNRSDKSKINFPPNDDGISKKIRFPPNNWNFQLDSSLSDYLFKYDTPYIAKALSESMDPDYSNEWFSFVSASHNDELIPDIIGVTIWSDNSASWDYSSNCDEDVYIKLQVRPGIIVEQISILVDNENECPKHIKVYATILGLDSQLINELTVSVEEIDFTSHQLQLLSSPYRNYISEFEIRFITNQKNSRSFVIYGFNVVKGIPLDDIDSGSLNSNVFSKNSLTYFPSLQGFSTEHLFYRSILLKRIVRILEFVLHLIIPLKSCNRFLYDKLQPMRFLFPLLNGRKDLIEAYIKTTQSSHPSRATISINRHLAREYQNNPIKDKNDNNTIFCQIYEKLLSKGDSYDYRWPISFSQWWECKFVGEGAIDQGGGFRDTISEMSEELTPTSSDSLMPLNLFIRTPNQIQDNESINRDTYTMNPACNYFEKYTWLGKLMGSMFRGKEKFSISLSQIIWMKLLGQPIHWCDFASVHSSEVTFINNLSSIDVKTFNSTYSEVLTFDTTLSNGTTICHNKNNTPGSTPVLFSQISPFCEWVKSIRLSECDRQIYSTREGLLSVIPESVLNLLTWQELEEKICGNPVISIDDLKKNLHFCDSKSVDNLFFWDALERFSSEERSRFLKFVTGRRRLPASVTVYSSSDPIDSFPTSATCGSTLYLPQYSTAEKCREKIYYAISHCVAIDTDRDPDDSDSSSDEDEDDW